jgi:outer membrane protein TolC
MRKKISAGLMIYLIVFIMGFFSNTAWPSGTENPDLKGMNYKECVEYGLENSPHLVKSSLEIDIRRLDETDSKWSFVPFIYVRSSYALNRYKSKRNEDLRDWSISFSTGNYDPLRTYFTLKAQEHITKIAILAHMQTIKEGIYRIAEGFIELESLESAASYHKKVEGLARENFDFVEKRHNMGSASLLEVQIAAQRLAVIQNEREKLEIVKASILDKFRSFLGLKEGEEINIDSADAGGQVLDDFDPATVNFEQVRSNSFLISINKIKEELQDWRITLAYADYIPKISFTVKTPDVAQSDLAGSSYYASVNAQMPLWEGFKRSRNVTRQEKILKQFKSETEIKESDLAAEWGNANRELKNAEISLKLAKSSEKLAGLKVQGSEIGYNSNQKTYSDLLESRMDHIKAQVNTMKKTKEYKLALLKIRHLSGDLFDSHVKVEPWEEQE